ncbi:hypothetical protein glysoja_022252 [Glycine soja]|nr:hypothetical protein glysoja_022252 [Glycine soja]
MELKNPRFRAVWVSVYTVSCLEEALPTLQSMVSTFCSSILF